MQFSSVHGLTLNFIQNYVYIILRNAVFLSLENCCVKIVCLFKCLGIILLNITKKEKIMIPIIPIIATIAAGVMAIIKIYHLKNANVEVKKGDVKDKADVTILFVGETQAGKDTVIELIRTGKFLENSKKTPKFDTIMTAIEYKNNYRPTTFIEDKIKIKIINTSGAESSWADAEIAKDLKHDIRCYIFDATKFYSEEKIKLGIRNTIEECKEKGIKYISLGTRGDEVDREKIENEVRSMGMECSIFELSKEPKNEVIKFLFKEYL